MKKIKLAVFAAVALTFGLGEMPPAGPNRPGRSDSGQKPINVGEIDWPE